MLKVRISLRDPNDVPKGDGPDVFIFDDINLRNWGSVHSHEIEFPVDFAKSGASDPELCEIIFDRIIGLDGLTHTEHGVSLVFEHLMRQAFDAGRASR